VEGDIIPVLEIPERERGRGKRLTTSICATRRESETREESAKEKRVDCKRGDALYVRRTRKGFER